MLGNCVVLWTTYASEKQPYGKKILKIKKGYLHTQEIFCSEETWLYYYEYNNKNAIIKANNPVASAKANPKIA